LDTEGRLDSVDWQLLIELQQNARLSYTEMGRRVGLTPPAVIERVRRMEATGVIAGYRTELNLDKVGQPVRVLIRISAECNTCSDLYSTISRLPGVLQCDRVTGDECYVVRVALTSTEQLGSLLERLSPFGKTVTSVVLSSPITWGLVGPERGVRSSS